ncbi:hypothetical protein [Streptomyces beihaiensis]|uniref:Minor tail protein n=1 Tax=Streptomyces beihaiensis TaxID=2984495 RepID=A0ABT3TXV7_9ACTN|nr:hypothetical protein [Streptomyces beihaiensis]MCX3061871.1 hypothetical protein [Streptomyces beihaiensis]
MTTPADGTASTTPYRAIFCDLRTDRTIDILPLTGVSFDDYIGKAGSLSGTVPVPNAELATRVRRIEEGRTSVYLERGNDLWWGGIIWTTTLKGSDKGALSLDIQAATFDSYAARRRIRTNLSYPATTDELDVARGLWQTLQSAVGGDIGVTYGTETSGVTRGASWLEGDETLYSEALKQLAALQDGFEYHITVYRDPASGQRIRRLQLGHPKIITSSVDLVFDRPGSILSYAFPHDATRGGTTAVARGASANNNQTQTSRPQYSDEVVAQDLIDAGYPRIDLSSNHDSVTDKFTLDALAATELRRARGTVVIPALTIRLDDLVPPALLGRTARVRITDEWFGEGLSNRYRIVGFRASPAERGRPDTAELYLEEVTS